MIRAHRQLVCPPNKRLRIWRGGESLIRDFSDDLVYLFLTFLNEKDLACWIIATNYDRLAVTHSLISEKIKSYRRRIACDKRMVSFLEQLTKNLPSMHASSLIKIVGMHHYFPKQFNPKFEWLIWSGKLKFECPDGFTKDCLVRITSPQWHPNIYRSISAAFSSVKFHTCQQDHGLRRRNIFRFRWIAKISGISKQDTRLLRRLSILESNTRYDLVHPTLSNLNIYSRATAMSVIESEQLFEVPWILNKATDYKYDDEIFCFWTPELHKERPSNGVLGDILNVLGNNRAIETETSSLSRRAAQG